MTDGTVRIRLPRGQYVTSNGDFFGAKRLIALGGSKAIVLPLIWTKVFAPDDWVEVAMNGETGEIVLRPMTAAKLEAIREYRTKTSAGSGRTDPNHQQAGG